MTYNIMFHQVTVNDWIVWRCGFHFLRHIFHMHINVKRSHSLSVIVVLLNKSTEQITTSADWTHSEYGMKQNKNKKAITFDSRRTMYLFLKRIYRGLFRSQMMTTLNELQTWKAKK